MLEEQIRKATGGLVLGSQPVETPRPRFLLAGYKRGVVLPSHLPHFPPFRILVRSSNWLGDAVMSMPAVKAIKRGRPDAHVTMLTPAKLSDFWRSAGEIDGIIPVEPATTCLTSPGSFAANSKSR
jgi:hypothetical protein